ncbi:MAG: mannitol dehydrogenase family protein [Burkholderiales bacterium]|nr:mannitol dehydrogenase family protein [Burkholderiales bacterium]
MHRLSPEHLQSVPPQVRTPAYDRGQLQPGIVHLGIGAFARAHLAAVNEEAIEQTGEHRFGITGVSMRSSETSDALVPQSGLYTLALRDADAEGKARQDLRVIGNLVGLRVTPQDAAALPRLIAAEATRIVSLTVTEKGYCRDPATGALLLDHADIAHDLAHPAVPRSAIGAIVRGLEQRHHGAGVPLTLMSLDNLPSNGDLLRSLVLAFAQECNPPLAAWIDRECTFPNSMVDRIVPRTSDADREAISAALGLQDQWPVVAEPFLQWAVEDRFVCGRPRWEVAGVQLVDSARPFERLKLRMVNATHSALAYLSVIAGLPTVDAAMASAPMRTYIQRLTQEEIIPALGAIPGVDLPAFAAAMASRFANPALAHQTQQIAMDGSQKLPQRILVSITDRLEQGTPFPLLAMAVAAWLRYLEGADEKGAAYRINDPLAAALAQQVAAAGESALAAGSPEAAEQARVASFVSYTPVFGALGDSTQFISAVAAQSLALRRRGALGALAALPGPRA